MPVKEVNYDEKTIMKKGFPKIKKLGAINRSGEMTPFVYKDKLMRMELMDSYHGTGSAVATQETRAAIRDCETNEILSYCGEGCYFHSAYTEDDRVYVLGVVLESRGTIRMFESDDLLHWEVRDLFNNPGWVYYNTGLTKGPDGYVLLMEASHPKEHVGEYPFTHFFATSPDLKEWTMMDYDKGYSKERYMGGPWLRYSRGYYYMFACAELPCRRYTNYLYRTKDFDTWEISYYNPILMPDEDDRLISSRATETDESFYEEIKTGFLTSNSDIDMCDYNGKVYINYLAGNQLGFYYMAEAECEGTVDDFLANCFE